MGVGTRPNVACFGLVCIMSFQKKMGGQFFFEKKKLVLEKKIDFQNFEKHYFFRKNIFETKLLWQRFRSLFGRDSPRGLNLVVFMTACSQLKDNLWLQICFYEFYSWTMKLRALEIVLLQYWRKSIGDHRHVRPASCHALCHNQTLSKIHSRDFDCGFSEIRHCF